MVNWGKKKARGLPYEKETALSAPDPGPVAHRLCKCKFWRLFQCPWPDDGPEHPGRHEVFRHDLHPSGYGCPAGHFGCRLRHRRQRQKSAGSASGHSGLLRCLRPVLHQLLSGRYLLLRRLAGQRLGRRICLLRQQRLHSGRRPGDPVPGLGPVSLPVRTGRGRLLRCGLFHGLRRRSIL